MSIEELHQIKELPDLKVAWYESHKYLDEPLLEYVWEVANHFLPDYEDISSAPAYLPTDIQRKIYLSKKDTREPKK